MKMKAVSLVLILLCGLLIGAARPKASDWCSGHRKPGACYIDVTPSSDLGAAFVAAMSSGKIVRGSAGRYELPQTWNYGGPNGFQDPLTFLCTGCTIDGNGLQHFLYMGDNFRGEGFRLEGFVPVDSGVMGALAGTYQLKNVTIIGTGVYDINVHAVYITRASTVTIDGLITSAIGGASIHAYAGENTDVPGQTININNSQLQSLHANVINDTGRMSITSTRFGVPAEQHVREGGPAASVTLASSCQVGAASEFERFGNVTGALPLC